MEIEEKIEEMLMRLKEILVRIAHVEDNALK